MSADANPHHPPVQPSTSRAPQGEPLPRVLILGAGGFLGLNTVRACLDAGLTPRCGRRPRGNVLGLRGLGVPLAVTDFTSPESLVEAMRDIDVVIHTAAHYPRFSHDLEGTLARGLSELEAVLDAAAAAHVRRFVYVSSTATIAARPEGESNEDDHYRARPAHGTYHALKWTLEQRALAETRFELVIANPSACIGPFDWKVGTSSLLVATARGLQPPHPRGRISTVDARDVGAGLLYLATASAPPRRLILSGDDFDAHELLVLLARRYGAPPPPAPLTADAARALADAQEDEALRTKGRALLPRELVDLIVHAPQLDTSRSLARGLTYRPLNDTLDAWDTWARRMGMLPAHDPTKAHA
ncbi:MAG: NAD-dependent epimerase/dehydratase family protein [Myxococcota bacterium]